MTNMKWSKSYYETIHVCTEQASASICLDYYNQRVRLDNGHGDATTLLYLLEEAAVSISAQKCIAKIRPSDAAIWLTNGYVIEGIWDGYFAGELAWGVCRYIESGRRNHVSWAEEDVILRGILSRNKKNLQTIQPPFHTRLCDVSDASMLAELYASVFPVYPTPVSDPEYLSERMQTGTFFFAVFNDAGKLVSAAAAEPDHELKNAEITDCATDPAYRGMGWTRELILNLETHGRQFGWITTYALCRAGIGAMNATMFDLNYQYRGRFANNCRMENGFENMNLWLKWL